MDITDQIANPPEDPRSSILPNAGTASSPLLYSLAEFSEVIVAAFGVAEVRSVMEIGSEAGMFTQELADWVAQRDATLYCVDPRPGEAVRHLAQSSPHVQLLELTSHSALDEAPSVDAYLLDGDHNYFTAIGELQRIEARDDPASPALIIAQDVDWPWGRRDIYYDPSRLPKDVVHPYTFDLGVVPWSSGVTPHGFRGHAEFAVALEQGGPANGVRTAIEDFLEDRPGYRTIHVPCVFGLMFIFRGDAPWADEMVMRLGVYDNNPLLRRLERNRIDLYLQVLELQDELGVERMKTANIVPELEAKTEDLNSALAIVRERLCAAEDRTSGLAGT